MVKTVNLAHERDREVAVANAALSSLAGGTTGRFVELDRGSKQEPTRLIN